VAVSDHVRDLLALAAAGALDPEEARRVAAHVEGCAECAAEAERWRHLARELGRLPAPKASPLLVARTVQAVEERLAERAERAWNRAALGFLVAFAWTLAVVAFLAFDLVAGGFAAWLGGPIGPTAAWYAAYLVAGWLSAGAAAVLLGRRTQEEGRVS
jgi:anti-sigma factor RsiW